MTKNQVVIGCKNDINHNPAEYWETIMEGWGGGGVGGVVTLEAQGQNY